MSPPETMPWWRSRIIIGALVSILMKVLVVSGFTADVSPADSQQIVDLVLILIGATGDLVAIGARVRQKFVPAITAGGEGSGGSGSGGGKVLAMLLLCAIVVPIAGCSAGLHAFGATSPAALSDRTKVDEQAALTITLAYTGAARAAAIAIETGFVSDPATVRRIGHLDQVAYAAVKATNGAYRAGNAADYQTALGEARTAVSAFLAAVQGDRK